MTVVTSGEELGDVADVIPVHGAWRLSGIKEGQTSDVTIDAGQRHANQAIADVGEI